MRLYGLMITKDDQEVFEDWCRDQLVLYDAVVCLDGSESDDTALVAARFGDRLIYLRERDFEIPHKTDHGLRAVVHAEIARRFGVDNWVMCCHADEFCYHDPRKIAELAESRGHDLISWLTPHFYPHPSELPLWNRREHQPVTERFLHYHWSYRGDGWPWSEDRLYRNGPEVAWDGITHGNVRPGGIERPAPYHPILRHYKVIHMDLDGYERDGEATRYRGHWEGREHRTGLPFRVDRPEDLFVNAVPQYSHCTRFDGVFAHDWNIGEDLRPGNAQAGDAGGIAGKSVPAVLRIEREDPHHRVGKVDTGAVGHTPYDWDLVPARGASSDSVEEPNPNLYLEARDLAVRGLRDEARTVYRRISGGPSNLRLRALVANDLAVISASEGDTAAALAALLAALAIDPGCEVAKLNLALLQNGPHDENMPLGTGPRSSGSAGSGGPSRSEATSRGERSADRIPGSALRSPRWPGLEDADRVHAPELSRPELSADLPSANFGNSNLMKPSPSRRASSPSSRIEMPTAVDGMGISPIKVAVLSFLFNWPTTGGGNVHTYELVRFLGRAGYDVRHIFARYLEWGIGDVQGTLPYPSEALVFEPEGWDLGPILARYRRAVADFDPDCVILTDSWNMKPLLAEAVRGFPFILRLQALECLCPLNNVRLLSDDGIAFRQCHLHQLATPGDCRRCLVENGHTSGALHQAERSLCGVGSPEYHEVLTRAFAEAEAVLVVNPLAEAMVGPHAKNVRVVTAGMDAGRFPWPPPADWSPTGVSDPHGRTVIFFAGLAGEVMKGFAVLHEACRRLWRHRQDFVLVASSDPAGGVDEFTRLIGWQSQEDLPRLLRAADIVAFPTIAQEALGRTAVEAMGVGRPVVASRLGGLPFTVIDGATGLLCEPGDPDDLARKLETLIDDPDLRERMGQAGRKRFEEHYTWDVIIERHYRPLLKRRRRDGDRTGMAPARATATTSFTPDFPDRTDRARLIGDAARFFDLDRGDVERHWRIYTAFHESKGYERTLGEFKTLCFEEAFILYLAMARTRPRTIVEVGTQHGKSTRRILDMAGLLGLKSQVICFDLADAVEHFSSGHEAELILGDVTGRFRRDVLEACEPDLIFLDVHTHGLLREVIGAVVDGDAPCVLVIHDCGRGLCNPNMAIARDDPGVTSATGVWERHVLAEAFGIDDPLSDRLDDAESTTHRLAVFATTHGLGVIRPKVPSWMKSGKLEFAGAT